MIRKPNKKRDFTARNHTILTGFRHKQKKATLIPSTQKDLVKLLAKNVIIYATKDQATLNYKFNRPALPYLEKNLIKLND